MGHEHTHTIATQLLFGYFETERHINRGSVEEVGTGVLDWIKGSRGHRQIIMVGKGGKPWLSESVYNRQTSEWIRGQGMQRSASGSVSHCSV